MKRTLLLAVIILALSFSDAHADEVQDLLNYYVKRFNPETASLVIAGKPDSTGLFSDLFRESS